MYKKSELREKFKKNAVKLSYERTKTIKQATEDLGIAKICCSDDARN